jgi:RNA polymerase sigma factor (TIGR02999 family)
MRFRVSILQGADRRLWEVSVHFSARSQLGGCHATCAASCLPVIILVAILDLMDEVTRILSAIEQGDPHAAGKLLELVYAELRRLAARKMAQEKPGQTLSATGLVHEAYLRLFGGPLEGDREQQHWDGQGHFFAAAAEAMRRILIDNARRKKRLKHGGGRQQVELLDEDLAIHDSPDELLALDVALVKLALEDPLAAQVVKLRVFTGLSIDQTAEVLGFSRATAYRHWNYARAWLRCELPGT